HDARHAERAPALQIAANLVGAAVQKARFAPARLVARDPREYGTHAIQALAHLGGRPADDDRDHERTADRRGLPARRGARALQHATLLLIFIEPHARRVPLVGVLGDDTQGPPLTPPAGDER